MANLSPKKILDRGFCQRGKMGDMILLCGSAPPRAGMPFALAREDDRIRSAPLRCVVDRNNRLVGRLRIMY